MVPLWLFPKFTLVADWALPTKKTIHKIKIIHWWIIFYKFIHKTILYHILCLIISYGTHFGRWRISYILHTYIVSHPTIFTLSAGTNWVVYWYRLIIHYGGVPLSLTDMNKASADTDVRACMSNHFIQNIIDVSNYRCFNHNQPVLLGETR